jgi:DNA-binding transcriptional LysR family regulator
MRQGLKQIEFLTDPTSGVLAIRCAEIMNAGIMPAISERFLQQYPRVQLLVVHADIAMEQFDPLRERKVELLIGRLPEPFVDEEFVFEPLIQEPFVAVAGLNSEWGRRRRIELADLMQESRVIPPYDSVPGRIISGFFLRERLEAAPARNCHVVRSTGQCACRNRQICRHPAKLCCPVQFSTRGIER